MQDQELEGYFTAIKEDFNGIHERFDKVENRLDKIEDRLGRLEEGFSRVENICFSILEVVRGQDFKFREFGQRLARVEQKVF